MDKQIVLVGARHKGGGFRTAHKAEGDGVRGVDDQGTVGGGKAFEEGTRGGTDFRAAAVRGTGEPSSREREAIWKADRELPRRISGKGKAAGVIP